MRIGLSYAQAVLGEEFQEVGLAEAVVGGGEAALLLVVDGGRHLLAVGLAGAEATFWLNHWSLVCWLLRKNHVADAWQDSPSLVHYSALES